MKHVSCRYSNDFETNHNQFLLTKLTGGMVLPCIYMHGFFRFCLDLLFWDLRFLIKWYLFMIHMLGRVVNWTERSCESVQKAFYFSFPFLNLSPSHFAYWYNWALTTGNEFMFGFAVSKTHSNELLLWNSTLWPMKTAVKKMGDNLLLSCVHVRCKYESVLIMTIINYAKKTRKTVDRKLLDCLVRWIIVSPNNELLSDEADKFGCGNNNEKLTQSVGI